MMSDKRIVFLSEYGKNIGYGHLSRVFAILEVFLNERYVCEIYVNSLEKVPRIDSENHKINNVDWTKPEWIEGSINSNSVVFIDSYLVKEEVLKLINKASFITVFIDDYDRLIYPRGFNLRPSVLRLANSIQENYVFSGIDWAPVRLIYSNLNNDTPLPYLHKHEILITFGITTNIDLIIRVYELILVSKYKKSKIVIVASEHDYLKLLEILPQNVEIYKNLDYFRMAELYTKASFVITSTSTTSLEILLSNVPFVGIRTASNQLNLFDQLKKIPSIPLIDYFDLRYKNFDSMFLDATESFDVAKVKNEISIFKASNFKFGIKNILYFVEAFISKSLEFKRVDLSYAELYYQWYTDPTVLENSKNDRKVPFKEHIKWFKEKLSSSENLMYVCLIGSVPIGQLRLEIDYHRATIDYSIDKRFRGYSLGNSIIDSIPMLLKETEFDVQEVIGYVKAKNTPSMKIFKNCGYKEILLNDNVYKFVKELGI